MTTTPGAAPGMLRQGGTVPPWLILLLAASCGLIVANIYYAQPLIGPISASLGLRPDLAGLIVTMTQIGYGAGLLLVVPLGDLIENRRLILVIVGASAVALAVGALSTQALPFLLASLLIGAGSVAVQVLVPYAASLTPEAVRGQVVGTMMSGLMLGIMLARPVGSLVAGTLSWHAVYVMSALLMLGLAGVLRAVLPPRQPPAGLGYGALLASMVGLALRTPVLQRRAFYQFCLFGAFTLFWTTTPLLLAQQFHLSQPGIALFALAGVAGAVSAPLAGRAADRGWTRFATVGGMLCALLAFAMTWLAPAGLVPAGSPLALGLLVAAAIVLDFGATANTVLGQRAIFALGAAQRSRLNGLYIAIFFVGGAVGSAAGGWAYARGGWPLASAVGAGLVALGLLAFLTELRPGAAPSRSGPHQPRR